MCDPIWQDGVNGLNARRWSFSVLFLALGLSSMSGCNGEGPTEGLGNDGYATIQGEVLRASGAVYANGSVFIICGQLEDGWSFGKEGVTNEEGYYAMEMNAPSGTRAGLGIPLDTREFELTCQVRTPSGSPPFATATALVRFEDDSTQRATTTIDLQEDDQG